MKPLRCLSLSKISWKYQRSSEIKDKVVRGSLCQLFVLKQ